MPLVRLALTLGFLLTTLTARAQTPTLTPDELRKSLAAKPTGAQAEALAGRIRKWFGAENLLKGPNPKIDGLLVAWAVEAPGLAGDPHVIGENNDMVLRLRRVGKTDVYAAAIELTDGYLTRWTYQVDSRKVGGGNLEVYEVHPDSVEKSGIPKGKVTQMPRWSSRIFEGTERDWWIYVPAQYTGEDPVALMVFQDGAGPKGYAPTVFDNLIAAGEMPITIGVFINPGTFPDGRRNRAFEYDTLSDQYVRFLLEEILPEVERTYKLRRDPDGRAIAGVSSGGICAFTAAWERPDQFGRVMSWVGKLVGIASRLENGQIAKPGGDNYPVLIRKSPRKPIRVYLQDGENDLDNEHGNWPLANQEMASALKYKDYDYTFVMGRGFHSDRHGRAIFPEALRWLWRK